MTTKLLMFIEEKSTVNQSKMVEFLKEQFLVSVSAQTISNLLRDMDVTWKQVTNIPAAWNKPELLVQQANFVSRRGMDLDRTVVYVDESGFDLHSGRASGYAPSGVSTSTPFSLFS